MIPENYFSDPKYFEIVRRATGLLNDSEQRTKRIIHIASHHILLAARCKNTCVDDEPELVQFLISQAEIDAKKFNQVETSVKGFLALLELKCHTCIVDLLVSNIDARNEQHDRIFMEIFKIEDISVNLDIINLIIDAILKNNSNQLIPFTFRFCKHLDDSKITLTQTQQKQVLKLCNFFESMREYEQLDCTRLGILLKLIYKFDLLKISYTKDFLEKIIQKLIEKDRFIQVYSYIKKLGLLDKFSPKSAVNTSLQKGMYFSAFNIIKKCNLSFEEFQLQIVEVLKSDFQAPDKKLIEVEKVMNSITKIEDEYSIEIKKYLLPVIISKINHVLEKSKKKSQVIYALEMIEKYKFSKSTFTSSIIKKTNYYFSWGFYPGIDLSLDTLMHFSIPENELEIIITKWIKLTKDKRQWAKYSYLKTNNHQREKIILTKIKNFLNSDYTKNILSPHILSTLQYAIDEIKYPDFFVGAIHQCTIIKIIPSRIFVKIKKINKSGSIYIRELDDMYIIDIYKFKYEGNEIHVGQKLKAKIIEINEKGISLSLRL